jgi:hypothetical protein
LAGSQAFAQPVCDIAPEKKEMIQSLLCGQAAPEPEYRQFGPGCFRRSVEKRLQDSAVQILLYRVCGDEEFANSLEAATVRAMQFMEGFAVCASDKVDINEVMQERTAFVKQKAAALTCTEQLRARSVERRAFFQSQIDQSHDATLFPMILDQLSIRMEPDGSLVDN